MGDFGPAESLKRQKALYEAEQAGKAVQPVSAEEEGRIIEKMKALQKLLDERVRAKYKLEVQFGKGRTSRGFPFAGVISCWLSGTKLHGGGDEKIYECPYCDSLILPYQIDNAVTRCGHCGRTMQSSETIGERYYKLTEQDWAHAILKVFMRLDMDADIYLKYHPTDIRYKTAMEMARNRGGEEIGKARKNRGLHIYLLRNIIKDTKHGSDLYKRIRIFINA
jgi:DNA-directed RNA polymerase subunit M/transcription elongation factor TFIIS